MALTFCDKNRKWGHPCPMDTFLVLHVLMTYVRVGNKYICNYVRYLIKWLHVLYKLGSALETSLDHFERVVSSFQHSIM